MPVIGELIKRAIDIYGLISSEPNPAKSQIRTLRSLIEQAKFTAFGKKYGFTELLKSENLISVFQSAVPIHDYNKIFEEWWHYLLEGHQNVTWPGGQKYFALSSGTTSNSKYIPVTDDMLESIRKSGIKQIMSLKNFELPADFFEKQILMLGSSTDLIDKEDHLEGEISGISASNIPTWFKGYYKPGEEIAGIKNWDEKLIRIVEEAPKWDIGSISGIPSWIEMMLKAIIDHYKLSTIHDIWPNLKVYTSGGVSLEPYRTSFEKLFAHPIIYIDTYLASEGFFAMQRRPETNAMSLSLDNGLFFEFVPFVDENMNEDGTVKQTAKVLTLDEVEENVDYVLLVTTVAGAWRYMIGDTVMFTNKKLFEIKITGRTKHYLNVVGEQLSVHQMNAAIAELSSSNQMEIKEFVVATFLKDGQYTNQWLLGIENYNQQLDAAYLANQLDIELKRNNKNYAVARSKALSRIEIVGLGVEKFYKWSEEKKKLGGQTKIPRVMSADDFEDMKAYLTEAD